MVIVHRLLYSITSGGYSGIGGYISRCYDGASDGINDVNTNDNEE